MKDLKLVQPLTSSLYDIVCEVKLNSLLRTKLSNSALKVG